MYINTGGHEALEAQMRRYARAGHLRRLEERQARPMAQLAELDNGPAALRRRELRWVAGGNWDVKEVIMEAVRVAKENAGIGLHTRDAGL